MNLFSRGIIAGVILSLCLSLYPQAGVLDAYRAMPYACGAEKDTAKEAVPLPIWELSARSDGEQFWREMRVQRQGGQELINFRSVPKDKGGLSFFVYGVYLYGSEDLVLFRQVLERYFELLERAKADPFAVRKRELGRTSQHTFWLHSDGGDRVIEYTDDKNVLRGGTSMLGQETIQQFVELSDKYELICQLLDKLRVPAD